MKKARIDSHTIFLLVFPVVFLITTSLFFAVANAADVTLAWDANTEANLAGYKLYYDGDSDTEMYQGTGANEGDSPVIIYLDELDDSNSPVFTLTDLEEGQYYYFALTAFDADGLESDFSEEVGFLIAEDDDTSSLAKTTSDVTDSSDGGEGGGGGGCFISGSMTSNQFQTSTLLLVLASLVGFACRKNDKML